MKNFLLFLAVLLVVPGVLGASMQIGFGADVPSTNFTDSSYETTYLSSEGLTKRMPGVS